MFTRTRKKSLHQKMILYEGVSPSVTNDPDCRVTVRKEQQIFEKVREPQHTESQDILLAIHCILVHLIREPPTGMPLADCLRLQN